MFVGSRVISSSKSSLTNVDKESVSDVSQIVKFFQYALANLADLQKNIDRILSDEPDLRNANGNDIFKDRFQFLKEEKFGAEYVLTKVFNGVGSIEASQIKQADLISTFTLPSYLLPMAISTEKSKPFR